jgi:23S rRNA pseudouridine1911/1915/1917 synthase
LQLGKRIELTGGSIELPEAMKKVKKPKGGTGEKKPANPTPATPAIKKPKPAGVAPSPRNPFNPTLIYEDDAIVVANKPAGLTTMRHREEAEEFGAHGKRFLPKTLADMLPAMLGTPARPVIAVHRIDRDTSGLVVFARTRKTAEHLTKQFRKHTVDRRYLALTRGIPTTARVESVFVRDRGDGRRGSVTTADTPVGKRAVTHVKVLEKLGEFALVECRLETGRTHQVRIHLGEAGTPLCGETVYDRPLNGKPVPDASGAKRPMLHAARLGFVHPETGEAMSWDVSPPDDFAALLSKMGSASG